MESHLTLREHKIILFTLKNDYIFHFMGGLLNLENLSEANSGFFLTQIFLFKKKKVQRRGGDLNSCSPGGEVGLEPTAFPG